MLAVPSTRTTLCAMLSTGARGCCDAPAAAGVRMAVRDAGLRAGAGCLGHGGLGSGVRCVATSSQSTWAVDAAGAGGGASDSDGGSDTDVFAITDEERRIASTVHQPIDWGDVRRIERMMRSTRRRPPGAPGRTNVRKTEEDVWLEAGAYADDGDTGAAR